MNHTVGTIHSNRQARGLLFFFGLMVVVWALSQWILTDSARTLGMGAMAIAAVSIVMITLRDWRSGVFLFILWLLFEDLARKHLGNATVLFFGKDVLAGIICLVVFVRRREIRWPRLSFLVPLAAFFALALVQTFNTEIPNVLYGMLGMKLYFYYVPLFFVGFAFVRTDRDLQRLLAVSLGLGVLIAVLGIVQSIVGQTFLNPDEIAPELQRLSTVTRYSPITGLAASKATSVFVSGGRFGSYVILVAILAFGAQAYLLLTRSPYTLYGFVAVGAAVVAAIQSGSRGPVIHVAISFLILSAGLLWGAPWKWGQGRRLVVAMRRGFLVAALGLILMVQLFPAAIGAQWAYFSETMSPTSSASELEWRAWGYPLQNLLSAFDYERWPYGYGTGVATLGANYVARFLGEAPPNIWVENGWGMLILEMGILGPVLWVAWTGVLLIAAWRIVRGLRQTIHFPIALSIFWYAFWLLVLLGYTGINQYQNYVMNAYLWLLLGILFRLPYLARAAQPLPAPAAEPAPVPSPAYARSR